MTPLTVPEARAILVADEALQLSYEMRLAAGLTFGSEEIEAWAKLVESAHDRIAAPDRPIGRCEDCDPSFGCFDDTAACRKKPLISRRSTDDKQRTQ